MQDEDPVATRSRLATAVGLKPEKLTDRVLGKMASDPLFAHHLHTCAGEPRLLRLLLHEAEQTHDDDPVASGFATRDLVGRAAGAFTRWAASGFRLASAEVQDRRAAACATCPHLGGPGSSVVYQIGRVPSDRPSVCGLCGCDVRRKVRLATEACPDGRWGRDDGADD